MELENTMLSEISHTQKVKGLMFSFICGSQGGKKKRKGESHENEREISRGKGPRKQEERKVRESSGE